MKTIMVMSTRQPEWVQAVMPDVGNTCVLAVARGRVHL